MDEITFEDILSHYQLKIQEANDGIQSVKNALKKANASIEAGWKGPSAEACTLKLEDVRAAIAKAESELSETMIKLSAIGDLAAEEAAAAGPETEE